MTEEQWRACASPQAMLGFLRGVGAGSDRKFRLFACACCRRIWDRFPDPRNHDLVIAVENFPNGKFEDAEIEGPVCASSACEQECRSDPAYWVAKYLGRGFYKMPAYLSAVTVALQVRQIAGRERGEVQAEALMQAEAAAQAELLREVFGTPARSAAFATEWRTDTAVSLACGMYESRDFSAMPILADALQDAGCDSDEVLNHCRAAGLHVRGCWVVDAVLGMG